MASFSKYKKNPTVVGVSSVVTPGYYGVLGTLGTNDVILYMANGDLHTITLNSLASNWTEVGDSVSLVGSDWD